MAITIRPSTNQRNIAPGAEQTRVRVNTAALEENARGLGQIAQGAGKLGQVIMQKEVEADHRRLLNANNEVARRQNELKTELLKTRRGSNAAGMAREYAAGAARIRNEVYAKSGIKYKRTQDSFEIQSEQRSIVQDDFAMRYEQAQVEEGNLLQFNVDLDNKLKTIGESNGDLSTAKSVAVSLTVNYKALNPDAPPERVQAAQAQIYGQALMAAAIPALDQKNYNALDALLKEFTGKADAATIAKLMRVAGEYKYSDKVDAIAGRMYKNGETFQQANSTAGGATDTDESKLVYQQGITLNGLNSASRAGVARTFNFAQSLGVQAQISSAVRSAQRNETAGGAPNSWHKTDSAADMVLLDESGTPLPANDPRVLKTVEQAKASGWTEVLYHDAGSGLHLHLGGYKGNAAPNSTGGQLADNRQIQMDAEKRVTQMRAADDQKRAAALSAKTDSLNNTLFGIYNDNSLSPDEKMAAIQKAGNSFLVDADVDSFAAIKKNTAYFVQIAAGEGVTLSEQELSEVRSKITLGVYQSVQELNDDLTGLGVNYTQRAELIKDMGKKQNKEGIYGIEWKPITETAAGISGVNTKSDNFPRLEADTIEWAKREAELYKTKNGMYPSAMELTRMIAQNMSETAILNARGVIGTAYNTGDDDTDGNAILEW